MAPLPPPPLSLSLSLSNHPPSLPLFLFFFFVSFIAAASATVGVGGGAATSSPSSSTTWCVARSDASTQALQTALDYACASGADCVPIQSNGLCFLPNTIQAHASYAYDSYYQRKAMAPGSCDFAGTATIAQTDPSYGSCVYPSSSSTAGGTVTPTTTPTTGISSAPITPATTTPTFGGGGITPGETPPIPDDNSKAFLPSLLSAMLVAFFSIILCLSFHLGMI